MQRGLRGRRRSPTTNTPLCAGGRGTVSGEARLLRDRCTSAKDGRTVHISRHHRQLVAARARQRDPAWQADYQANRPKIERKLSHLVRRWHGDRRARMRGLRRVAQDWQLLAAAHNLARLAALGVHHTSRGWQAMPT
jgi:hypothetical protein